MEFKIIEDQQKDIYVKADDNKVINLRAIKWVKKINECLGICTKSLGCNDSINDLHKICKTNNPKSYEKYNEIFFGSE